MGTYASKNVKSFVIGLHIQTGEPKKYRLRKLDFLKSETDLKHVCDMFSMYLLHRRTTIV